MLNLAQRRFKILLVVLAAAAGIGGFTLKSKGTRFHYDFPQTRAEVIVVDEMRNPIANASAELTTSYWYPSLFGFGPQGKTFVETLSADAGGRISLPLRTHPQVTNRKLVLRAGSIDKFSTSIANDSTWLSSPDKPRIISVCTHQPPVASTRVNWNGGWGQRKNHKAVWTGEPLHYSLKTGSFEASPADIVFEVERPPADTLHKQDQPVGLRIRYTAGKIQWISSNEYWFSFPGALATWGDVDEIKLAAKNSRNWPTFSQAIAFSSSDGKVRGIMDIICSPIGESENDSTGTIDIRIATRAEFY